MPYSLVNMSVLGYDLVRLPHGPQVAEVLRAALACGPVQLARLRFRHPGPLPATRDEPPAPPHEPSEPGRPTAAARGTSKSAVRDAPGGGGGSGPGTPAERLERLERLVLGDRDWLEAFVRHEALGWTWLRSEDLCVQDPEHELATDVLCRAAVSAYCSGELTQSERRAMVAPFLAAHIAAAPTTGHRPVDRLIAQLAGSDDAALERWRRATANDRPRTSVWAAAMHDATWALHVSDRLRLAADAQLAAVVAFRAAGFDARDAAHGVWNAVSAAVHATVARDLLDETEYATLTRPWSEACGVDAAPD